jgi:hypothetical protein
MLLMPRGKPDRDHRARNGRSPARRKKDSTAPTLTAELRPKPHPLLARLDPDVFTPAFDHASLFLSDLACRLKSRSPEIGSDADADFLCEVIARMQYLSTWIFEQQKCLAVGGGPTHRFIEVHEFFHDVHTASKPIIEALAILIRRIRRSAAAERKSATGPKWAAIPPAYAKLFSSASERIDALVIRAKAIRCPSIRSPCPQCFDEAGGMGEGLVETLEGSAAPWHFFRCRDCGYRWNWDRDTPMSQQARADVEPPANESAGGPHDESQPRRFGENDLADVVLHHKAITLILLLSFHDPVALKRARIVELLEGTPDAMAPKVVTETTNELDRMKLLYRPGKRKGVGLSPKGKKVATLL